MKTILAFILIAGTVIAAPDLVVYIQSTGEIISYDKHYEIPKERLTEDGNGFIGGTNILGILSTTNSPSGKTNISQLDDKTILNPSSVSNDPEENPNITLKRVLRALVKTINLRLPADKKITAEELKQAIKDEL